jgi:hypothetical protein
MLRNNKRGLRGLSCRGTRCFWSHRPPPLRPGRLDARRKLMSRSHTIGEGRSIPGAKRLGLRLLGSTHEKSANDSMGHILVRDKRAMAQLLVLTGYRLPAGWHSHGTGCSRVPPQRSAEDLEEK